ncbi:MAG TPA: FAD binding domain-containing protein [Solirubrobacteraceae bacterium]|nr:FAD binding domain-containing protein [Solirubrobacteraceae bacterium]HUA71996.1 FAD binding domain-containing protein [Solirubrobacteraceae bacterium]
MYAAAFDYLRATSWAEAVKRLEELGDEAHVIAGGQSLVPMMMLRVAAPSALVDIGGADERTIDLVDGRLVLSALVRHVDLEHSELVAENVPMLTQAVRQIGNVRVRQRGTIGGSLAHGEPAAELPCVAIAHGASVHALGPDGEREIAVADLPLFPMVTTLNSGELITRVEIPALRDGQGSCFLEIARRPGDFAMVNVAAIVTCDADGTCTEVRLALGALGSRPVDSSAAAQELVGAAIDEAASESVGRAVAGDAEIGPSSHAGVDYRREVTAVLVARALRGAAADARDRRAGVKVAA